LAEATMQCLQSFRWALENDKWHARIGSIPQVFAAAAEDRGCSSVDEDVVKNVWDRLMPGLLEVIHLLMLTVTESGSMGQTLLPSQCW